MSDVHDPKYRDGLDKMFKLGLSLREAGFSPNLHFGEIDMPYCSATKWGLGLSYRSDFEKLFGLASLFDVDVRFDVGGRPSGVRALFHLKHDK